MCRACGGGRTRHRTGSFAPASKRMRSPSTSAMTQPLHLALNELLRLTDSLAASATLRLLEMDGESCVFDRRFERP